MIYFFVDTMVTGWTVPIMSRRSTTGIHALDRHTMHLSVRIKNVNADFMALAGFPFAISNFQLVYDEIKPQNLCIVCSFASYQTSEILRVRRPNIIPPPKHSSSLQQHYTRLVFTSIVIHTKLILHYSKKKLLQTHLALDKMPTARWRPKCTCHHHQPGVAATSANNSRGHWKTTKDQKAHTLLSTERFGNSTTPQPRDLNSPEILQVISIYIILETIHDPIFQVENRLRPQPMAKHWPATSTWTGNWPIPSCLKSNQSKDYKLQQESYLNCNLQPISVRKPTFCMTPTFHTHFLSILFIFSWLRSQPLNEL